MLMPLESVTAVTPVTARPDHTQNLENPSLGDAG